MWYNADSPLYKDFNNPKQGGSNVGLDIEPEDSTAGEEIAESQDEPEMDKTGEEAAKLHIEIKRLLAEKNFTDERLGKALAYYEVDQIEELGWEGAHHFIQQLLKL